VHVLYRLPVTCLILSHGNASFAPKVQFVGNIALSAALVERRAAIDALKVVCAAASLATIRMGEHTSLTMHTEAKAYAE